MTRSSIGIVIAVALWPAFARGQEQPAPAPRPPPAARPQPAGKGVAELRREVEQLGSEIKALGAQSATTTQTTQELAQKLTLLEQEIERLRREQRSIPDAVVRLDELSLRVGELRADVEALRTQVAGIGQAGSGGGAVAVGAGTGRTSGGFHLESDDGRYSMLLGGFMQPQYHLTVPSNFDTVTESTFRVRRARLRVSGHVWWPDFRYTLLVGFERNTGLLADGWVEYKLRPELTIRAGQDRVLHSREFATSSTLLAFPERAQAVDNIRYDRDIGVWAHGLLVDERLYYRTGLSNGAGQNALNDNIDFLAMARVEGALLGKWIKPSYGDVEITAEPRLQVGAAILHDLVRVPETVAGIEVGNRDVDEDLVLDNVRAISAGVDATFRYRGLELTAEWLFRHERWGTILEHTENEELANEVDVDSDGHRNYQAFVAEATYFVMPRWLMVGARVGHVRIPLLGVTGRQRDSLPLTDRLFETDLLIQLYHPAGWRLLGLQYSLFNFNERDAAEPPGDIEHRFILAGQILL